ncbi:MAG TPA: GAF domain-containing protein [Roseiflexaceae bacterium]|nr:GAF domain-containing protein [Roseiflexaceae bacterium]
MHERNPSIGRERHAGHLARKRTQVALHRRDTILEAVSFAAERFLGARSWKHQIQAVLERLGAAAGVSRVYLFENHAGVGGELVTSQRYEWAAPGITPQLHNPELQSFSYQASGFERWEQALGAGELVHGPIRTFPPAERALLAKHDIHSIAVVPVYVGQVWWGHIGFDNCRAAREWTSAETDALKTASSIIGAAIEREHSEAALRESEQRYRELFAAAQRQAQELALLDQVRMALASELEPAAIFRTVVEAVVTTLGYTHASLYLLQEETLYLQHEVGYDEQFPRLPISHGVMGRVAHSGKPVLLQDVRTDPTFLGTIDQIVSEVCVPLFDQGRVMGVLNVESTQGIQLNEADLRLITALGEHISIVFGRARLYAEVRESEERYRRLVEFSPEPIAVHSGGRMVFINPAGVRLLGAAAPEELIGRPILDFVHPDYHAVVVERVRQTQAGYQAGPFEEVFVRLDGQFLDVEVVGIPTTYLGNPATQVVIRDVTERKRVEAERLAFERRLLETQKLESLGVLAGGIAHDFNNLLMGVLGNASLALLDLPAQSPAEYSIRQIESAARRAAELTRQMLAYAGKGQFVVQAIDLNAIVEEMSRLAQVSFGTGVSLQRNLDRYLPHVQADAAQMRQVVMNLVINASEAIGDARGTITLTTGVRQLTNAYLTTTYLAPDLPSGSYAYLEVTDAGCGMDAATLARIFEPFFTTRFTGRGLGLSAVLGIVRGHRGALQVQSEPGSGTTFTVFIPTTEDRGSKIEDRNVSADETPSSILDPRSSNQSSVVGRVLVIEDDPSIRALAARMLKRFGYDVLIADDGYAGVAAFSAQPDAIDCVLLDMNMPNMDGAQTLQEIQRIRPGARVVLMSGHDEQEIASQFAGQTLASVLSKPFSPAVLREHMRRAMTEIGD